MSDLAIRQIPLRFIIVLQISYRGLESTLNVLLGGQQQIWGGCYNLLHVFLAKSKLAQLLVDGHNFFGYIQVFVRLLQYIIYENSLRLLFGSRLLLFCLTKEKILSYNGLQLRADDMLLKVLDQHLRRGELERLWKAECKATCLLSKSMEFM